MTRDEAIADIATAMNDGDIGGEHMIDGIPVSCVRRSMTTEELQLFSGGRFNADGMLVEGCRLTADGTKLRYLPVAGGSIDIDGAVFDIKSVQKIGINYRITCLRYLS